jgi:hypothetical protein
MLVVGSSTVHRPPQASSGLACESRPWCGSAPEREVLQRGCPSPPTQTSPISGLQSQQRPRACLKCPRSVHCCSGFWFFSKFCVCHSCNLFSVAPPATSKFSPCWTSPSFTRSASQGLLVARLSVAFLLTETKRNEHNLSLFGCTSACFRRDFILLIVCQLHYPVPHPGGVLGSPRASLLYL